jgi:tyrosyl-tRNA synthetase
MQKLKQFQDFGHDVTFLIGSFTSLIGDPDDKTARKILTPEQVIENAKTYTDQAFKILDRQKITVRYNDEWLSELNFLDVIKLAQNFTVQQFIARDAFSKRIDQGNPIYLHEFFYPLMQGYDAVALETDVQVGGQDQLFNLMAGRQLMKGVGVKPQIVIAMGESLPGTDGVLKMSKSKGNHIPILSEPGQMYTSLMKLPDSAMPLFFKLMLGWSQQDVDDLMTSVEKGERSPQDVKSEMAFEITKIFHGEEGAIAGREFSQTAVQQGGIPDDIEEYQVTENGRTVDLLVESGLLKSKGDAKRQINGGGIRRDGEKVSDIDDEITLDQLPVVLQFGKRNFVRLIKA